MSQRVVSYAGEGKSRRPIYADEGPAAPNATDGLASLGRLSALTSTDLDDGAGRRIERREISQAEIDARRERDTAPAHLTAQTLARPSPGITDTQRAQVSRQRGADANRARAAAAKPSPGIAEDPVAEAAHIVSTEPEAPRTGLAALADALVEAMEAEGELEEADHLADQARIRWTQARAALAAAYRALDDPPPAVVDSESEIIPETIPEPAPKPPPVPVVGGGVGRDARLPAANARRAARDERRSRRGLGAARLEAWVVPGIARADPQAHRLDRSRAGGAHRATQRACFADPDRMMVMTATRKTSILSGVQSRTEYRGPR